MLLGISYLVVGAVFALLVAFLSDRQPASDPDAPTYRYDLSRIWCFIALGSGILPAIAWLFIGPAMDGSERYIVYGLGFAVPLAAVSVYVYCLRYRIVATDEALVVHGLVFTHSIPYRNIREVVLKDSQGRGAQLELFDNRGKRILTATDSFDYLGICGVVRTRAAKYGVLYRHRDAWGKWA
ncbi:hypothetical protein [Dyella sp. C11]|uniref:hypothetical protein n=1 Tax=Dyella sp. C11 TaxID=2126991 RepID=UPI000D64F989|nr:hypothetical protein [Dyella sp. C11]